MAVSLSLHNWMRPEDLERSAARARRFGYDSIELAGEPHRYEPGEARGTLEAHGLGCAGVLTLMTQGRDLASEDPYIRRGTVRYVEDCVDLAVDAGGEVLTIVPTEVGKLAPMASSGDEWAWCIDSLRACNEYAEERGVRLALEPLNRFETYLLLRVEQALILADAVGGTCGICLDTFHMNIEEGDMRQALRDAGSHLANLHAADSNRLAPGQGSIDWPEVLETLAGIDYDGCVAVEFVPPLPDRTRPEAPVEDGEGLSATELRFMRDHAGGWLPEPAYDGLVELAIRTLTAADPLAR